MIPNICTLSPVNNGFNKSYDYNLIIYHVITTDHNIYTAHSPTNLCENGWGYHCCVLVRLLALFAKLNRFFWKKWSLKFSSLHSLIASYIFTPLWLQSQNISTIDLSISKYEHRRKHMGRNPGRYYSSSH